MYKIDGQSKTVRQLLSNVKYAIDDYQREFRWTTKNIEELIEDLDDKFTSEYSPEHERTKVQNYGHYFLGSVIINQKDNKKYIIDGQQRLTFLTLLLTYLNNLAKEQGQDIGVQHLIFSKKFGEKTFNLDIDERTHCMKALFESSIIDVTDESESVINIYNRYNDIQELFPDHLKLETLPYFVDWLIENVDLVEITAYSDDDAYKIFETMNDRGLSLSPTDMLKGYLLVHIEDPGKRKQANELWKGQIHQLLGIAKEEETDFFKAWLRAKYATSIRERKRGAVNQDFEIIGTTFHKWVRDNSEQLGLHKSSDFYDFIDRKIKTFSKQYILLRKAATQFTSGLESVYYNAHNNLTLQYPLIIAPLQEDDEPAAIDRKIKLVAGYLDIFVARRIWNFRTLQYSSIVYSMFSLMKEIRDKDFEQLASLLGEKIAMMEETFSFEGLYLHQQNRRQIHYLLARMTQYVDEQTGGHSKFTDYISRDTKAPFEIEHIWASNKFNKHSDEFENEEAFLAYRERIGDLLLLPRGFNQSFGAAPYEEKLKHYYAQNTLAKSLSPQCYERNPVFLEFRERSNLPFEPYEHFTKKEIDGRQKLYSRICDQIWNLDELAKKLLDET